ncbi:Fc.00g102500.m01.CDS01 [Cosmosporella sp. VM-42]
MKTNEDAPSVHGRRSSSSSNNTDIASLAIERAPTPNNNQVYHTTSHISGPDAFEPQSTSPYHEAGDEIYDRFSRRRKAVIVAVLSLNAFLSPISSTSVLAATPEVAAEYGTTGSIINVSNAGYMVFMGLSPLIWGPMTQVFGRWPITILTGILFFLLSLATALAPNLAAFFVFRALSAFEGTAFILLGPACIGDIYKPTERGTAMGWFFSGTLIGPAFGPFLGGVIVTYSSWRTIFWLQTAMAGAGVLASFFFIPETAHHKKIDELKGCSRMEKFKAIMGMINPYKVLRLFRYWNLVLAAGGSSSLTWNMYTLLTPIRYVLNPRFHLETPLLGSLFYLAPGCGYLLGTFMGGHWADYTVKRWIKKRGVRVPEDRLRSALPFMGVVIPGSLLVYGWSVEKAVGGIPLPVIAMFVQGVAQLFCFPSLNTYCLDVMQGHGADVAAANFSVRYLSGCVGTAVVLPAIQSIGVGWFSTITAGFIWVSTLGIMASIQWGKSWRDKMDDKLDWRREEIQRQREQEREQAQQKHQGKETAEEAKSKDETEEKRRREDRDHDTGSETV